MYLTTGSVLLVLKIPEEDVLDDRLIGRTFSDDAEFEHSATSSTGSQKFFGRPPM